MEPDWAASRTEAMGNNVRASSKRKILSGKHTTLTCNQMRAVGAWFLMDGVLGSQREWSDLDVELSSARAHHLVSSAHQAGGGFQRAPRGVFERLAWTENGLLTDYARSLHLFG